MPQVSAAILNYRRLTAVLQLCETDDKMEHYCRHAESNVNSRSVDGYMRQAIIKVGERFGRKVLVASLFLELRRWRLTSRAQDNEATRDALSSSQTWLLGLRSGLQ
jgi:hypothetical protein